MPEKNEADPVSTDVLVAKGNIVIERNNNTRIILPPTKNWDDLIFRPATETTTAVATEISEPYASTPTPRCPECSGEMRRLRQKDGLTLWGCVNCGGTYKGKAA